jgi:RNA polymerase sigma-70 factor (ECF subfamily)
VALIANPNPLVGNWLPPAERPGERFGIADASGESQVTTTAFGAELMADPSLTPVAAAPPPVPAADGYGPPPNPETVFREYAPRIYVLARRLVGNDADAEDVTQDVLVQVIRKLHTFRGDAQLPTWLHRVTLNAALAHREKRANRAKRETGGAGDEFLEAAAADAPLAAGKVSLPRPPADRPPDELALAAEQRAVIEKAISRLPDGFREVYVLADVEGLPNADIGDALGLSVPAVKSRLHRARLRMREMLAPHFEEVAA